MFWETVIFYVNTLLGNPTPDPLGFLRWHSLLQTPPCQPLVLLTPLACNILREARDDPRKIQYTEVGRLLINLWYMPSPDITRGCGRPCCRRLSSSHLEHPCQNWKHGSLGT